MLGSGVIAAAPMAVKWWLQIASVSSPAPINFRRIVWSLRPMKRERAPSTAPSRIETVTSTGSHAMVPATSKAAMPV